MTHIRLLYQRYISRLYTHTIATNGKRARAFAQAYQYIYFVFFFLHVLTLTDTKVFCLRRYTFLRVLYFRFIIITTYILETSFVNRLAILCNNKNINSRQRTQLQFGYT